jgi:tRNA threonylcarbamoyladenosine biosynthesis protein TsaE
VKFKYKLNDIKNAATRFWQMIGDSKVVAFHGDMGAGKTTFIHALCEVKGVKDVIGSPTFSIINEYYFPFGKIFHIDLYRLKDEEEATLAGVEDCLYSDHICFVEWPEKSPHLFPDSTIHVSIEAFGNQTRLVRIREN